METEPLRGDDGYHYKKQYYQGGRRTSWLYDLHGDTDNGRAAQSSTLSRIQELAGGFAVCSVFEVRSTL